jgi:uncharacterized membrane protein YfcA
VPVLVYLLHQPEKVAIAGSLAIVGGIALAGVLPYARQRLVDWRSVAWFGLPGMAGTWGGAWLAQLVSGALQLAVFALVMLAAAWSMFRSGRVASAAPAAPAPRAAWKFVVDGLAVGVLTGFVGVGGGFLIVPALVLLGGLAMPVAIGSSLAIIALKSAAGFWKYLDVLERDGLALDWQVIVTFIAIGAVGSLLGHRIAARLPQAALKRGFAAFLVVMAAYILWRTLPGVL